MTLGQKYCLPSIWCVSDAASQNVFKCSQTTSEDASLPASPQKVSLIVAHEPELPAPQITFFLPLR